MTDWRLSLKPLRESLGMGMTATAKRAGISKAYLWKLERCEAQPSVAIAFRLAEALRVPVAELLAVRSGLGHDPGEHHRYRVQCQVCGVLGQVVLSIEPQVAA